VNGLPTIFDDDGKPLNDNVCQVTVTSLLISPNCYLTGLNPSFEVIQANAFDPAYANSLIYKTTNDWVALPGDYVGELLAGRGPTPREAETERGR